MDLPRLGMMIALSCLVAAPDPLLADGAAKGRGDTQAAGDRGAGRGTAGRGDGPARGNAPRRGTVVRSAARAPTTARRGVSGRQVRAGQPAVAFVVPESPETSPQDPSEPAVPAGRSTPGAYAESSSIKPLRASAAPQGSWASPRGALRLEVGPPTAQVYVDGFYVGTVEEVNRPQGGLTLAAGWHRVELRAPGYVTPAINVTIEANRTTSYRGELTAMRP
jgi:PEGA domain